MVHNGLLELVLHAAGLSYGAARDFYIPRDYLVYPAAALVIHAHRVHPSGGQGREAAEAYLLSIRSGMRDVIPELVGTWIAADVAEAGVAEAALFRKGLLKNCKLRDVSASTHATIVATNSTQSTAGKVAPCKAERGD